MSSLPTSIGSSAAAFEGFEISLRKPQNSWTSMAFVDLITTETDFLDFHNLQVENTEVGRQPIRKFIQNSWTSMAFVDLITAETDFLDFHNLQMGNTAVGRQYIRKFMDE